VSYVCRPGVIPGGYPRRGREHHVAGLLDAASPGYARGERRSFYEQTSSSSLRKPKIKPNNIAPMLWRALKPTYARHIVVCFVMTGEIWLMLMCSAGSRSVSFGPQNV
jgi:hypothetical protein